MAAIKESRVVMGMPSTIHLCDDYAIASDMESAFNYLREMDEKFSTYKETSEITAINEGRILLSQASKEMLEVLALSEDTYKKTYGYFDIHTPDGKLDPSGLVKGWAIWNAAKILYARGLANYFIDVGSDIQTRGTNLEGKPWSVGIRDPFAQSGIVKKLVLSGQGIATSGSYLRGDHIYNPHEKGKIIDDVVSITVIGPNVYEADRFATAAFAMGRAGIEFIETLAGFEGYMIDSDRMATMTSGFSRYIPDHA